MKIEPQVGPQTEFLETPADIALYGGAAGGGKTFALLLEPLRHYENPHFGSVIFRRTTKQIRNEGALWDEAGKLYPHLRAEPKIHTLEYQFPKGMRVQFSHLEHEKNKYDYQGAQIPFIGFDEVTHFSESQFWYILSRNRSTSGVPGYIRATCNADAESWVRKIVDWWIDSKTGYPIPERSGVLRYFIRIEDQIHWANQEQELYQQFGSEVSPKSFTFIPAKLQDNQILMKKDPSYLANLKALPLVERMRLLEGNWNVKASAGMVFRKEWFEIVSALPANLSFVRYWDRACLIAGTEVMTEQGIRPIEDIKPGEFILTRKGMKKVKCSGLSKLTKQLISVVFSDGNTLTGTPDHPIYVLEKGWIDLCKLKPTDKVLSLKEEFIRYMGRKNISTVMSGIKTKKNMSIEHFIERFGEVFTVQSPTAYISTIKMETGLITQSKIWNVFQEKITPKNIKKICHIKLISKIQNIEKKHCKLFEKGWRGSLNIHVNNAMEFSTRKVSKRSIVNHVNIKSEIGGVPVYDLTVEECHEFFANGILVHNSTEPHPGNQDPDYTVGMKVGKTPQGIFYIADLVRIRVSPHKVEKAILNTAKQDGIHTKIYLEQDPGQAGVAEVHQYSKLLAGFEVKFNKVSSDKQTRARAASAQAEAGNIKLLESYWNDPLLTELSHFPEGKHDDQVDALSGCINSSLTLSIGKFTESLTETQNFSMMENEPTEISW